MAEVWQGIEQTSDDRPLSHCDEDVPLSRHYATWSAAALETLLGSSALTPIGERFTLRLRERLHGVRAGT
jgi:hypothetical protein